MYKSANSEVKARLSYYEYMKAKFDEGLADSTDLTDAIAKLSTAKAKKEAIKANIFFYTVKANLDGGEEFDDGE
jgi:outer membrane protein